MPKGETKFRSGRGIAYVVYVLAITAFLTFLTASVWAAAGQFQVPEAILVALLVGSFGFSGWMAWAFWWNAPLVIAGDELIYRPKLTQVVRIRRSDVSEVGVEKTEDAMSAVIDVVLAPNMPTREIPSWVAYLKMRDGSTVRLGTLSAGVRSGIDIDDYYGERMQKMLAALKDWVAGKPPTGQLDASETVGDGS